MKAAFALRPIATEIARQIRDGPVLHLDDTPIKVFRPGPGGGRDKLRQSQLWVFVNPEIRGVAVQCSAGRSAEDLASLLRREDGEETVEFVVGDGLETNRAGVRQAGMKVHHAGCWAHLLRKFRDALAEGPNTMGFFMGEVKKLYAIEERANADGMSADERLELRRRESMPIAIDLLRLTSGWESRYSTSSTIAKAMKYARNQRRALLMFLRDGRVPIDNNVCERAIRPIAIGRRNWTFAGSLEGAEAAAIAYTIVESAKASRVDPLGYVEAILSRIGTWPADQISELMPWRMAGELPAYREPAHQG